MKTTIMCMMVVGAMLVSACAANAQVTPPGRVYYLRVGSSEQTGCFGACQCPVLIEQPMRGRFLLTRVAPDPLFDHYTVSNVIWNVRSSGHTYTGGGTYRLGGEVALLEQMSLSLSRNSDAPRAFDSGLAAAGPGPAFPVIRVRLEIPNQACWNTELTLNATSLMGDWNGDGLLTVQDIFDFVGGWFGGDGDMNDDGANTVQDLFEFVNAWFSGN